MTKYERLREILRESTISSHPESDVDLGAHVLIQTEDREKLFELLLWFAEQGPGIG